MQTQPEDREFKRAKVDIEFTFSGPTGSSTFNSSGTSTVNPTVEFDTVVLPYQPFIARNASRLDWIDNYLTGEMLFMTDTPLADTNRSRIYANYVLNLPQFNYMLAIHSRSLVAGVGDTATLNQSVRKPDFHCLFNLVGLTVTDKKDPAGVVKTTTILDPKVFNIAQKKYTTIFNEWENNVKPSAHLFFVLIKRVTRENETLSFMLDITKDTSVQTDIPVGNTFYECLPMVSHHKYPTLDDILHPDGKVTSIRNFANNYQVEVLKVFYVGQVVTVYNKEKTAGFPLGRGYKGRARNQIAVNVHANTIDMRCINDIARFGVGAGETEDARPEPEGREEGEKEKEREEGEKEKKPKTPLLPFNVNDKNTNKEILDFLKDPKDLATFERVYTGLKNAGALDEYIKPSQGLINAFNDYLAYVKRRFEKYDVSTLSVYDLLKEKLPEVKKLNDKQAAYLFDNMIILHMTYIITGNKTQAKVRLSSTYEDFIGNLDVNPTQQQIELLEKAANYGLAEESAGFGLEEDKEESLGSLSSDDEEPPAEKQTSGGGVVVPETKTNGPSDDEEDSDSGSGSGSEEEEENSDDGLSA
jgi:hypothetical protein